MNFVETERFRALVFVRHIQEHLKENEIVICKICKKNIDEIYKEYIQER